MSAEAIRPSSLDGIKRLAKALKNERGISHSSALDAAAQAGGFQNFRHARNVLNVRAPAAPVPRGHAVYLTSYWRDQSRDGTVTSGRETLRWVLRSPWQTLVKLPQLGHYRYLPKLEEFASDHLVMAAPSQSRARRDICMLVRVLQFMEVTGLRPSGSHSRAYPNGESRNSIPGTDHSSIWYNPATRRHIYLDEPYEAAAEHRAAERAAWAERFGFTLVQPAWPGMYNPDGGTRLYLTADAQCGVDLQRVVTVLEHQPPPLVEANWTGESAPARPFFVSPAAAAAQSKPIKVAARRSAGPRATVAYSLVLGRGRRPTVRMAIEDHERMGRLLKPILTAAYERQGVYKRLNSVRAQLDDWIQCEYPRDDLPSERFFQIYYKEESPSLQRSISPEQRAEFMQSLQVVKEILASGYPDCPPVRALQRKIDAATSSLAKWG